MTPEEQKIISEDYDGIIIGIVIPRGKRFFCWHDDDGAIWQSKHYSDIRKVQCSKCGWFHYADTTTHKTGELLRRMFT